MAFASFAFLSATARAEGLADYLDRGYAIAPDQAGQRVIVFDAKAAGSPNPVWEWRIRDAGSGIPENLYSHMSQPDEAKLRDGGRTLLVTSSGPGWAVVDVATKKAVRYGTDYEDTHSMEILPDGTLVLAQSTEANKLLLILPDGTRKNAYDLYSAHGVEWDVKRNCLWALGYTTLVKLAYDADAKTLTALQTWTLPLPSGHDMRLNRDGKLYFTNWYDVWEFDPDADAAPRSRFSVTNAKGFDHSAAYGDVYQTSQGQNYSSDHVTVRPADGGAAFDVYPVGASRMYKVHWASAYPAAWDDYLSLAEPTARVAADGNAVTISVVLDNHHNVPATLSLALNGATVKEWTTEASGAETYAYTCPVLNGSTNAYALTAVSAREASHPQTRRGAFVARATELWFDTTADDMGGAWELDAAAVRDGATGRVTLDEATATFTPAEPSRAGDDVVLELDLLTAPLKDLPTEPRTAGFCFLGKAAVPYGYANGQWHELAADGWTAGADAVRLTAEFDFSSEAAPRVRYALDGVTLTAAVDGADSLALAPDATGLSSLGFKGTGVLGRQTGTLHTFRHAQPLVVPSFGGDGSGGGGDGSAAGGGGLSVAGGAFSMTLTDAVPGAYYCAFTAENLTDPFIAERDAIQCEADGTVVLNVDAEADAKFAVVVVSPTPIPAGTRLSDLK